MRKTGIVILIAGLLLTVFTGFSYVTEETILDIGDFEINAERTNRADWSPMAGVLIMVFGGLMIISGEEKK